MRLPSVECVLSKCVTKLVEEKRHTRVGMLETYGTLLVTVVRQQVLLEQLLHQSWQLQRYNTSHTILQFRVPRLHTTVRIQTPTVGRCLAAEMRVAVRGTRNVGLIVCAQPRSDV